MSDQKSCIISASAFFMSLYWTTSVSSVSSLPLSLRAQLTPSSEAYFDSLSSLSSSLLSSLSSLLPTQWFKSIFDSQSGPKGNLTSFLNSQITGFSKELTEIMPKAASSLRVYQTHKLLREIAERVEKIKEDEKGEQRKRRKQKRDNVDGVEVHEVLQGTGIVNPFLLQAKRPLPGFFEFSKEQRKAGDGANMRDVSRIAGEMWSKLDEEQKDNFNWMFEVKKKAFEKLKIQAKEYEEMVRKRILEKRKAKGNHDQVITNFDEDSEQRMIRKKLKRRHRINKRPLCIMELCDLVLFKKDNYNKRFCLSEKSDSETESCSEELEKNESNNVNIHVEEIVKESPIKIGSESTENSNVESEEVSKDISTENESDSDESD